VNHDRERDVNPYIAAATAILLRARSFQVSAMQAYISLLLKSGGAESEVHSFLFNPLGH